MNAPAFRCGHPRSAENTKVYNDGKSYRTRCRTCWQALKAKHRVECRDTIHLEYRVRNLPRQIESTRAKLVRLEAEALRLGMADLLERRA